MDYLRSIFGPQKDGSSPLSYNEQGQTTPSRDEIGKTNPQHNVQEGEHATENRVEKRLDDMIGENVRNVMKQLIPLADDDCLSCKLIGTSVMWGSGLFLLVSVRRITRSQTGMTKKLTLASYITFASSLFMLGSARLFDLSIFAKDEKRSIYKMAKDDFKQYQEFFQNGMGGKK